MAGDCTIVSILAYADMQRKGFVQRGLSQRAVSSGRGFGIHRVEEVLILLALCGDCEGNMCLNNKGDDID